MALVWRFLSNRGENNYIDRLCASAYRHGALLKVISRHACGLGGCDTNDHLAGYGSRRKSRSDIDGITERRKVVDGCARPGGPNECHAGVDCRSDWNGRRRRGAGLCRPLGQIGCGCYRCRRVALAADPSEEEPNNLVAHDFVNDAVMSNDRIGRQPIEAVEKTVEVCRAHSLSHRSRAANIGEQHGDRDLYPGHLTLAKHVNALRAESWIARGLSVPRVLKDEPTQSGERSCAQLAPWRGRDPTEHPPLPRQAGTLPG
jgi:hypothetical protein